DRGPVGEGAGAQRRADPDRPDGHPGGGGRPGRLPGLTAGELHHRSGLGGGRRDRAVSRTPRQPVFYFSLRSPYSWLAYRDLLDRYPDVAERVRWEPFWEPDESWRQLL